MEDSIAPPTPEELRLAERQAEIKKCLIELHSNNPHNRSHAARRLGELRSESEALLEMLEDRNGFVRSAAAEALGHLPIEKNSEIVEALLSAIDDANDYVCAAAVNSLGLLRASQALEQVLSCLEDRNPIVVQATILALARIAPPGIAEKLASFLTSDQYLVHLSTVRAMGILGYAPAGPSIQEALEKHLAEKEHLDLKLLKLYIEVLTRLQVRTAIPVLIEIARRHVGLRSTAVEALVEMKAEEAASTLAPLLYDPSNRLRRYLIEMMVRADYRAALPVIRALLKDVNITIREAALEAIGRWQDRISIDTVRWMCYHDSNPFVRPQAVTTLFNLLGSEALPDLLSLAEDLNMHVRRAAAYCLGRLEPLPDEAVAALNRLAAEPETAESAQTALTQHQLSPSEPCPPPMAPAVSLIPDDLQEDAPTLLDHLEVWQNGLAGQSGSLPLEDMARIDQALCTLIVVLREHLDKR